MFQVGGFQSNFFNTHFANVSQLASSQAFTQIGSAQLYGLANQFSRVAAMPQQQFSMQRISGFAATPDFANAGHLEANPEKNTVKTPGGFEISVNNGMVKIKQPNGKWTTMKAEPPGRTQTSTTTGKQTQTSSRLERVLRGDPAVRTSDGEVFRYQGLGTFKLPDGTKIRINEIGEGKNLHINQVDIYNGNKHVAVKSQLTKTGFKTVKTDVKRKFGPWRNIRSRTRRSGRRIFRDTTRQRQVTTTTTRHQVVDQKFKTTMSEVKSGGFMHDAMNKDGFTFTLAGKDGAKWSQFGREVISGAGKGKDDKTKAYKLGGFVNNSMHGARNLHVPWKMGYFDAMQMTQNQMTPMLNTFGGTSQQFFNAGQSQPHLGGFAQLSNWGNIGSTFAGPFGGGGMFGSMYNQSFSPMQTMNTMFGAVSNMNSFFGNQISMGGSVNAAMMMSQFKM